MQWVGIYSGVKVPEERDLNEILRPPHGGGLHQVPPEKAGPPEAQNLRRQNHTQGHQKGQLPAVENLHGADYMDRVRVRRPGVGEDRYQHVLLHIEVARVEAELPLPAAEENPLREHRRHEVAEGDHGDLGGDGGDGERLAAVKEELVEEGEEDAGRTPQNPHPEGDHRQRRVVGLRHGQRHLIHRRVFSSFSRNGGISGRRLTVNCTFRNSLPSKSRVITEWKLSGGRVDLLSGAEISSSSLSIITLSLSLLNLRR